MQFFRDACSDDRIFKEYGEVLGLIHDHGAKTAILVGGCIRDTIFQRPVKDMDFMVTRYDDVDLIEEALKVQLYDVLGFDRETSRGEYDEDANVLRVLENKDKTINVLVVRFIASRIQTFPDSISQVCFTGHSVLCTQAFQDTFNTHVITHSHEPMRPLKTERRERIVAKYPDFTFKETA